MPVLFYFMEELSDYCGHDCNADDTTPFSNPEAISGDSVYRYWFGPDTVERKIYESPSQGN